MRKELNSQRIYWVHQHSRLFIFLEHQYGRRDVMWKRSIPSRLIRQMLAPVFVSKLRKRKRRLLACVPVLDNTWNKALSRCSRYVQWRLRKVQKSARARARAKLHVQSWCKTACKTCTCKTLHMQSCCFANLNLLLFCRYRRRHRCLSSLLMR